MHALALTRAQQMAHAAGTVLTPRHLAVLEYAWQHYRQRGTGPIWGEILQATGVDLPELERLFPDGLASVHAWAGIPARSTASGCKPMALLHVEDLREVYLDHHATTPLRPEVVDALVTFLQNPRSFGNPSSAHGLGTMAYEVVARARQQIADCLEVSSEEIYFVGSGSEANNLALRGAAERWSGPGGHIITSNVEHPSVMQTLRYLETQGFDVTYLPVHRDGTLTASDVAAALRSDTMLVCIMAANNEIGTLYPLAEIGAVCRHVGVPFAVDAVQAFGKIPLHPKELGVSYLSASGHKINAPKGVGFLFVDSSKQPVRQIHGGSQERGLRAGTENVAGIMALGLAAHLSCHEMRREHERQLRLRDHFLAGLRRAVPDAVVNGTLAQRLPHSLSVSFAGLDSGSLLLSLNQIGVQVSAGSACSTGQEKSSHVLRAIGVDEACWGTLRLSFGQTTTEQDLDYVLRHLPQIVEQLRAQPTKRCVRSSGEHRQANPAIEANGP